MQLVDLLEDGPVELVEERRLLAQQGGEAGDL